MFRLIVLFAFLSGDALTSTGSKRCRRGQDAGWRLAAFTGGGRRKSLAGVLGRRRLRSEAGFSFQVLGKALIGKREPDGVDIVAVGVFRQRESNFSRLQKFFGAVGSGNEVLTGNNIFSIGVFGHRLCGRFPAWENVPSSVRNVLDRKNPETSAIVQNFAHVVAVQALVPWIVFWFCDFLNFLFLKSFQVDGQRIKVGFGDDG
jgi:hypothetical protein